MQRLPYRPNRPDAWLAHFPPGPVRVLAAQIGILTERLGGDLTLERITWPSDATRESYAVVVSISDETNQALDVQRETRLAVRWRGAMGHTEQCVAYRKLRALADALARQPSHILCPRCHATP